MEREIKKGGGRVFVFVFQGLFMMRLLGINEIFNPPKLKNVKWCWGFTVLGF